MGNTPFEHKIKTGSENAHFEVLAGPVDESLHHRLVHHSGSYLGRHHHLATGGLGRLMSLPTFLRPPTEQPFHTCAKRCPGDEGMRVDTQCRPLGRVPQRSADLAYRHTLMYCHRCCRMPELMEPQAWQAGAHY